MVTAARGRMPGGEDASGVDTHARRWHDEQRDRQCAPCGRRSFNKVVDAAEDSLDLLAERVVQLGDRAEGTIQGATTRTGLQAYPLMLVEEREHVEASADESAAYGARIRLALEQTDTHGDTDTADIGMEISWGVDTYRWSVEAHLGLPARQETRP